MSIGDGATLYEGPSAAEIAASAEGQKLRTEQAEKLESMQKAERPYELSGYVAFVTYKKYANVTFLAKAGKPVFAPIQAGMPMGTVPVTHRDGDVWVKFVNGVCTTNDPEAIEWCQAHPDVCRRADDPRTRAWEALKSAQVELATREALIDGGMNVDELVFGDREAAELGDAVMANSGEVGVVDAALASEHKANVDAKNPEKLAQ